MYEIQVNIDDNIKTLTDNKSKYDARPLWDEHKQTQASLTEKKNKLSTLQLQVSDFEAGKRNMSADEYHPAKAEIITLEADIEKLRHKVKQTRDAATETGYKLRDQRKVEMIRITKKANAAANQLVSDVQKEIKELGL